MVTVVATQELEAGDVLWRFKAGAAQDEPHRGKNNTVIDVFVCLAVWKLSLHTVFFSLVLFLFISLVYVCVMLFFRCLIFYKVIALACWYLAVRDGNVCNTDTA